ncbi:MAG TPA: DUF1206 domain-containing protein [Solirubrobacteraceae bacterium]|jgi:hypothetical protein|nr:DUF1206 domain-containing protein [Solirubrobacteraceae bacterium]
MVRAGFVARSLTYGVIGVLALAMAVGDGTGGTAPDQQGALALIARAPAGRIALVVICAGLLGYALWKFTQGFVGHGPEGGGDPDAKDRVANIAGGIVYLLFFIVAVRTLMSGSSGGSGQTKHAAAGVLGWPGGQVIVGIAGLAMIGISLYQLSDAVRGKFAEDRKTGQMDRSERKMFMGLGRVGLSARSLVFALVGYFLVETAIDFKPSRAVGVNGALERLQHEPFGPWLLGLVAAGLLTFAAYSLLEARFRRL